MAGAGTATATHTTGALQRLVGHASAYAVSQRTVKERCLAKVLYSNDALLQMVKSAADATTVDDPVLRLPPDESALVVAAINAELSQVMAGNFFNAEASRHTVNAAIEEEPLYYEHQFPFALVYSRLGDRQKLRVVLGAESLVSAWATETPGSSSSSSKHTGDDDGDGGGDGAGDGDSMEQTAHAPEGQLADPPKEDLLGDANTPHFSGCVEYLDVLAALYGTTHGERIADQTTTDSSVPVAGAVKFMLPFPPWSQDSTSDKCE